jgi:hypothetical protein
MNSSDATVGDTEDEHDVLMRVWCAWRDDDAAQNEALWCGAAFVGWWS